MAFMEFIKNLAKGVQSPSFDASIFDHPLALKTEWSPKARGGANFKTRTLKQISNSEVHYVGSTIGKIFAGFFIGFPIIFLVIGASTLLSEDFHFSSLLFLLIPLIFMAVGSYILRKAFTILVIDKGSGYFHKGKKARLTSLQPAQDGHNFKLSTIRALQIIPERVKGKNSSYTSYEINFIFEDASRYNLVDHGKLNSIETDASTLSDFLEIPIWNKVSGVKHMPQQRAQSHSYNSLDREHTTHSDVEYSSSFEDETGANDNSLSQDLDGPYDSSKPRDL